jgi:hypothetical protein
VPRKKHHHVVPRFYLKGFADDKAMIFRRPLVTSASSPARSIGIGDAMVRKDFYRVEAEGTDPDIFENALGAVESETAPAFDRLITETSPMSLEDRHRLAVWIALQYLRSEATRRLGEEIYRATTKLEVSIFTPGQMRDRLGLPADIPDQLIEEMRASMLLTADTFKVDHRRHLNMIAENLRGATRLVLFRNPWIVVRYSRRALATSDTPVVLVPRPSDLANGLGTGIGTAAELFVPISRRVGLAIGELPDPVLGRAPQNYEKSGNTKTALWMNNETARNARRVIFHHPADSPLDGLAIPSSQRESEVDTSSIDDLIRAYTDRPRAD